MIEHFRRVMNYSLLFTIIDERGDREDWVDVGVERDGFFYVFGNNFSTQ